MKRVLFAATVASHIRAFHLPFISLLQKRECEVEVACYLDVPLDGLRYVWAIPFSRSPYSRTNISAFEAIRKLLRERRYDLIHVHTPVAGFLFRFAARNLNVPVLYTAHGFHFYKGAPLKNHLIYGAMERLAVRWTAGLIVMNREDLEAGRRFGLREGKNLFYVHGVGVDLSYYGNPGSKTAGAELNIPGGSPIALCVAEMIPRKNHLQLLAAWRIVTREVPEAHLLLAGDGELRPRLESLASKMGLSGSVHFLGYRSDIPDLVANSNVVVLTSKHEGLPRCIMEAMAAGKPVVATDVRGSRELIRDGVNGLLVPLGDPESLAKALIRLLIDKDLGQRMGTAGHKMIQEYSLDKVLQEMWDIYQRYL